MTHYDWGRPKIINALSIMHGEEDNGNTSVLTGGRRKRITKKLSVSNQHVAQHYVVRGKFFSGHVPDYIPPDFLNDTVAYQKYIPELPRRIADEKTI